MGTLRSRATEAKYDAVKASGAMDNACALCDERETLAAFKHWRIVENLFPYDAVAKTHHMIVSLRHAPAEELTAEEKEEFEQIKQEYIHEHYEFFIEPTPKRRSIPAHAHFHMIIAKDEQDA